ncbi:hypothetical protein [Flammeovirga kamogawensis]|uniref:PqqD family protein n=1 Tax=Flammeovirga kamogawensis TaxID=373891 RepID=A0ABX8H1Z7_9BACT|nr:hypothetical protein [Flammeovirga kamogawensis]MBB6464136.1 hypothetical protein [Flammeovirga kamogawensis]QWG09924.1 hypothetical protein KM029_19780 [Flammeovirga kamogawensis]TRX65434.1 hypothetical protein EO216_23205 [Flammeovirga kamogawensis]
MFGLFKKKERTFPPFEDLKNSSIKNKFFTRVARWDWLDESKIHVIDNNAPRMITMDPWPQHIFLEAKGQITIHEFVYEMASQYGRKETIPNELDKTVLEIIDSLLKDKLITLIESKLDLPYYFDKPISKQNNEKANKLMLEDGLIKE